jgi:hypothetical protein
LERIEHGRQPREREHGRNHQFGQTLVEFALVFPVFLTILIGFIEFVFVFNSVLTADLATRGAALAATEGGTDTRADCAVLKSIEDDFGPPTDRNAIQLVEVYEATATGAHVGPATIYDRGGTLDCSLLDGTRLTLPYSRVQDGFPAHDRCTALRGCDGIASVDHVGVRVVYRYHWRTPFPGIIASGPYLNIERSNVMRMEPEQ